MEATVKKSTLDVTNALAAIGLDEETVRRAIFRGRSCVP